MTDTEYELLIDGITQKKPSELTPEDYGWLRVDGIRCEKDFLYWFRRYAKLSQAPTQGNPGGIMPFILWPHTLEIIKALQTKPLISILKSRQIGASWLIAAFCLWNAEFHESDKTLLFSKGELEAAELLYKCKQLYDSQPNFLKISMDSKSNTKISFTVMHSSIEALAATENAGIGYQVSRIVCDEHIEHPYAGKNYMAAKPAIDSGGGQFISVFTSNENKLDSLAVELFLGGLEGKNGFTSLFFPYTVRPGRSADWYEQTKRSVPESELQGITPDIFMARNYPRTVEEALAPSKTIAVFDKAVLDSMVSQTESPVQVISEGVDSTIVHIYRPHIIGDFYVAASDTSHGVGQDYNCSGILNVKTGSFVADIYNNKLSPEELAMHTVKLLKLYHDPLWFPEDNDWGRVTITTAQNLGYKNIGDKKDSKGKTTGLGFHTDERTRTDVIGSFIPAVNNRQVVIYNIDALKSLYDIIRQVAKNGRIEAMSGRHDDFMMMAAIAWYHRDRVKLTDWNIKPISSLHFASPNSSLTGRSRYEANKAHYR